MTALRTGASPLWLDRAGPRGVPRYPTLRSTIEVDVVIVGGGVTGAAVAWLLTESGIRVALLESRRVGCGSTAASTALLMQEPDEDFGALRARYGRTRAARIWRRSQRATAHFVRTLTRLDIRCDLARCDSVYYTQEDPEALQRELAMRRRAGLGGRWLDEEALERATGISAGVAIRTRGNAQVDPYKVCVGLLGASEDRGAAIFEHTRARRIDTSNGVVVHTEHGQVRAGHIVVATGYATAEFKPLVSRFRLSHTYVLATRRLSAAQRRRLGLSRVMLWDTGRPYHYARWTPDGRLLLGGGDRPVMNSRQRERAFREGTADVRTYFSQIYPELLEIGFDRAWEGLFGATPDGLPYVGPHLRYPGHLFALGFGGNGITFGFLAAELIRERLLGQVDDDHTLFSFGRIRSLARRR